MKRRYELSWHAGGRTSVEVGLRGRALVENPLLNKGTAFSRDEREALGLRGLLPAAVSTMEQQVRRAANHIRRKSDPLEKYIGLAALHDRNEHLFYRVLHDHMEELLPIVYTPTVGLACQHFSHIFRRARGLWITPDDRGRIEEVLRDAPTGDARLLVATDNERILGLGDQGAGGMGIPVGKLALYTLAAGIHPTRTLPISLDVGTDNQALLDDDLYLGWRHPRLRGDDYDALVEEFVEAVQRVFPRALLQWEDFKKANAFRLLDRYRERLCSFNDDIQGTAGVALAGIYAACRATETPMRAQRVLIVGAGAAGIGIARQVREAMRREGLDGDALTRAIALVDRRGLLVDAEYGDEPYKADFCWRQERLAEVGLDPARKDDLRAVVEALRPTVLIGTTGQAGIFDEGVVRAMAAGVERPVVFPFSNPTKNAEARPADVIAWTEGRAFVATGSPFPAVEHEGRRIDVSQGNNVYVFPGVGLGALVAGAREVTESMFAVAAQTLAGEVVAADLARGALLPPLHHLRQGTARIAEAVVREAQARGVATEEVPEAEIPSRVAAAMWWPEYPTYRPV